MINCLNSRHVLAGTKALVATLARGAAGLMELSDLFETCEPLHDKLDIATFVGDVMGTLQGIIQGNHVYSSNETTVSIMCGMMKDAAKNNSLAALLTLASPKKNHTGYAKPCRDVSYSSQVKLLKNGTWGSSMDRQWTWQVDLSPESMPRKLPVLSHFFQCACSIRLAMNLDFSKLPVESSLHSIY